jgi:hypothetical protein
VIRDAAAEFAPVRIVQSVIGSHQRSARGRNVYQKLHVQTQSEAVATAIRKGLI